MDDTDDTDDTDDADDWPALLRDQHGIISRTQALRHGFTDAGILAQVTARRWRRVGHGAVATFTGPLTAAARRHAALVAVAGPAALSHRTAGRVWGMLAGEWPSEEPAEVTVPYGASAQPRVDLVLHRSRAFEHIVVEHDGLLVVDRPHTALDLALAEPDAMAALRLLLHLALRGSLRADQLAFAVERRRPRRYRRACLEAVRLLRDGVTSPLEARYVLDVETAHGLPRAERQTPFALDSTTVYEDCLYPCPDGLVVVRLDGHRYHADPAVRLRDRRRGNAAEVAGRARLEYGWEEVTRQPCRVAREVAEVLAANGWTGEVGACGACAHLLAS